MSFTARPPACSDGSTTATGSTAKRATTSECLDTERFETPSELLELEQHEHRRRADAQAETLCRGARKAEDAFVERRVARIHLDHHVGQGVHETRHDVRRADQCVERGPPVRTFLDCKADQL